jgi:hypothetical protein
MDMKNITGAAISRMKPSIVINAIALPTNGLSKFKIASDATMSKIANTAVISEMMEIFLRIREARLGPN